MPEIVVIVAIGLLMGTVVGLSLWRFEKKRADAAVAENARLQETLQQLRLELAEVTVDRNATIAELGTARQQLAEAQATIERLQQQLQHQAGRLGEMEALKPQLERASDQLSEVRRQLAEAQRENAELKARMEEQSRQFEDKIRLLESAREQLKQEFEHLATRLLDEKRRQFVRDGKAELESVLKPWQAQLDQFRARVDALHTQQTQQVGQLQGELKQLRQLNETLAEEARELTRALEGKKNIKLQGNWGELVLERLLEAAGLREGKEFVREATLEDEQARRQRPDVLIRLPEGKHIVIDAKVSLSAYLEAVSAEDEAARRAAARRHLESVRRHIKALAQRQYHRLGIDSPDFTLMFMPVEGAYLMAVEEDPNLQMWAYDQGVAIVTPPTLLVTLKTVSHLWKLASRDRDVAELLKEAQALHKKFSGFMDAFFKVETRLKQAQEAWETAQTRLQGRGGIISRMDRIGRLSGVQPGERLDEALVSKARLVSEPDEGAGSD